MLIKKIFDRTTYKNFWPKVLKKITRYPKGLKALFWCTQTQPISAIYKYFYKKAIDKNVKSFEFKDICLSIEPMNVCNAKCVMCVYPHLKRKKEMMSFELFKKIIDDCASHGIRGASINVYSEPLLDPLIFDRIKYLKEKGFWVKLFTNMSVADDEKINKIFESGLDILNMSLDSLKKETYEKIRGLSFEDVTKNINKIIEEKKRRGAKAPVLTIVFVGQDLNNHEKEEFFDHWRNKGIDKLDYNPDNRIIEIAGLRGIFDARGRYTSYPCQLLWKKLVVLSSGKVALCCMDYEGEYAIGDFKIQTLKEIWESDRAKNFREMHLNFKGDKLDICKKCSYPYYRFFRTWWMK